MAGRGGVARAVASTVAVGLVVSVTAACTAGTGPGTGIVLAWSGEPQNPLIPTDTSDNTGGRVLDAVFAGLVAYTADGGIENEVAESIDTPDAQHYTVTLEGGWTFTDGSPVTAASFVDAWNYGALSTNAQLQASFFAPIDGYDEVAAADPTAQTMSGLRVLDDRTFTITLEQPESAFPKRLGFAAYYPLPQSAYADMPGFGRHPIGNGPYRFANDDAWQHNVRIDLVANPDYRGGRVARNDGVTFVLYSNLDTAYTDLVSNNLDVVDGVPASALEIYEADLPGRTVNQPSATIESFTVPQRLPHFGGEEGRLRRQAISRAIDRPQITARLFAGTRSPARDLTSPAIQGWTPDLPGSENLDFAPDRARADWAQADAIAPWTGSFRIAYNSDGGHQDWVDAVCNSIRNTLGIDAHGAPYPTFAQLRTEATNGTIDSAFRSGWQADYPQQYGFLAQNFETGGSSNDGGYSNPRFDALLRASAGATDPAVAQRAIDDAQEILLRDLPAVPNWNRNTTGGWSEYVTNVRFGWDGIPLYYLIEKK